jgi:hypothetical protein
MSEVLKRKLHDYEVNPSETVWNKIASALDEEINAEFPQKIYDAEVTPPADTWNKIETWLNKDIKEEYPAKLYNLEVAPPAATWQKISDALQEEKALPRIPSKRKMGPFVRYAVAACFLGVIALGAFKLLNRKTTNRAVVSKNILPQNNAATIIQPGSEKKSVELAIPATSNNLPKERTSLVKTDIGSKRKFPQTRYMAQTINPSPVVMSSAPSFQQASLRGSIPGSNSMVTDADRYLMFMNPDGYLIRMSKKLAEALGCFYTNGNSEEYKQCQDQIKKWRDKIAQSSATSSPDNFMDILDIIKSAQDKEL